MMLFRPALSLALLLLPAVSACVDKPFSPRAPRNAALAFRANIGAQTAPVARTIAVTVYYQRSNNTRVVIATNTTPVVGTAHDVTLALNLAPCLEAAARDGARDSCPIRVAAALRDTSAIALDSVDVGPYDAAPGRTPTIAPVDLAIQRFTVRQWLADESLKAGGDAAPFNAAALSGLVVGAGAPVLYTVTNGTGGGSVRVLENGRWRSQLVTGIAVALTALAMVSANDGWIASTAGLLQFDGTAATPVATITESIGFVAAAPAGAPRFVIAATTTGAVWHGNGTTWTRTVLGGALALNRPGCVRSQTEAYLALASGLWSWNGVQWALVPGQPTGINQVACAAGQLYAANATATIHQWNGTAWSTLNPASGNGSDFAAVGPAEVYLVRTEATPVPSARVWHRYNGTAWNQVARFVFPQSGTMWADPRGGRVYRFVGFGRVEMYDAAAQQASVVTYVPALRDVMFSSPTNGIAVGWNTLLARWNGTQWTVDEPPTGTTNIASIFEAAWTDGPNSAWAVGGEKIYRWNGTAWLRLADNFAPLMAPGGFAGIWGANGNVYIAGNGAVVRCTAVSACTQQAVPGAPALRGIWGVSEQNIFAVGAAGRIVRSDGATWTDMQSPTTRNLIRVWAASANDAWAVGDSVLLRYDGASWTNVPFTGALAGFEISINSGLQGIVQVGLWGSARNDVYLGSTTGKIARFDGAAWSVMPTPTDRRILAIAGVAGVGAFAIAENQTGRVTPTVLRGVGATGGFGVPGVATVWK